jgi:hypothetical protein
MKALGIAAAAAIAFAPLATVVTTPGVAEAAPCAGAGSNPASCQHCLFYVTAYHTANVCYQEAPPHPEGPPPTRVPVRTQEPLPEMPDIPSVPVPVVVPSSPSPPTAVPVQTPTINPVAPGAPRNAAVVPPPKPMDAPAQAIAAAKAAPPTRINPASPLEPPMRVYDFNHQVQNVVNAHSENVDIVKVDNQSLVRPRHWDYIDYDDFHRPTLYNPLSEAMTFRYSYNGGDREAFVPAGGRIVLDVATVGVFAFTAVGDSHLASGSFSGGAWIPPDGSNGPPPPNYTPPVLPEVYQNVLANVAGNQTVEIGQVQVINHDPGQPAGNQDTFLLDDSTLAWGQVNDGNSSAQIKVNKAQALPVAGPTDNGSFLVALAARGEPSEPGKPGGWPFALGYGGLAVVVGLSAWLINRRKRSEDEELTADS